MYDMIKSVIQNRTYSDLNKLLQKIKRFWIEGSLTDSQYDELNTLAADNGPVKDYAVQEEIDRLWAAVHAIEARLDDSDEPGGDAPDEPGEIPEFVQPTGAHDAYHVGDKVTYNGKVYQSLIDGNVWAPDVYPAGWQELN